MNKPLNNLGFTLVEIAVAIAILGVALTTLLGIQSNIINSYLNEANLTQAALYGQYIMTLSEISQKLPDEGASEGDLAELLEEKGYYEELDEKDAKKKIRGWKYSQSVNIVDILTLEDALRKITLTISWGEADNEKLNLVYYREGRARIKPAF